MSVRDCIKGIETHIRGRSGRPAAQAAYQSIRDCIDHFCASPSPLDSDHSERFTSTDVTNTELALERWTSLMMKFFDTAIGFQGCLPSKEAETPFKFEDLETLLQEPSFINRISTPLSTYLDQIKNLHTSNSPVTGVTSDIYNHRAHILCGSAFIADRYYRFNLWNLASKNISALLEWNELALQTFLDSPLLTELDLNYPESKIIHSKFQDLQDSLFFKIAKTRGIVPSTFYIRGITRWGDCPIGRGGFAEVWLGDYKGAEENIGRQASLAIKVLTHKQQHSDTDTLKAICREAVLWKKTSHPNVLKFIGVCYIDIRESETPRIGLVSPRMEKGNLLSYAKQCEDVDKPRLLAQTAHGLVHLHSVGIIHGDLKCSNVLVNDQGVAQLADFGLSSVGIIGESISSSLSESFGTGNPRWLAPELMYPEQFNATGKTTFESDVYAFAMTALELFTEEAPFVGLRDPAVFVEALHGYRPLRPGVNTSNQGLTDAIWALMEKCWHHDPFSRPKTRGQSSSDLLNFSIASGSEFHLRCYFSHQGFDRDSSVVMGKGRKMFSAKKGWFKSVVAVSLRAKALKTRARALQRHREDTRIRDFPICSNNCTQLGCDRYPFIRPTACRILKNTRRVQSFDFKYAQLGDRNRDPEWCTSNVVPIIGYCETFLPSTTGLIFDLDPQATLVLDYIAETSMTKFKRLGILEGIANGLSYLHRLNIVHGDLRSANIVVEDDIVRLVDYSIPTRYRDETECTEREVFLAPEILRLPSGVEEQPTSESDIYSLAMTFYEILTEQIPFSDTKLSEEDLLNDITTGGLRPQYPGIIAEERGLSPLLWALMSHCWNADAKERPTADRVLEDIGFFICEEQRTSVRRRILSTSV